MKNPSLGGFVEKDGGEKPTVWRKEPIVAAIWLDGNAMDILSKSRRSMALGGINEEQDLISTEEAQNRSLVAE